MAKKNAQVSGFSGRTIGKMLQRTTSPTSKVGSNGAAPKKKGKK